MAGFRRVLETEGIPSGEQDDLVTVLIAEVLDATRFAIADHALLEYTETLTRAPATITSAHIARLRAAGFDDRAIHDTCAIVAYFAFVNRIADGLGVELET